MPHLTLHGRSVGGSLSDLVSNALEQIDVRIDGSRPWDIHVYDRRVLAAAARGDSLALGIAYERGEWDCERIDELIYRICRGHVDTRSTPTLHAVWELFRDGGSRRGAKRVAQEHYNLGNELFREMLDPRMVYSCAYWANATSLAEAQEAKLDLVCRKLGILPGMRVLDIGGGWGSFAKYAAERYGASVVSITVSQEQKNLADELCEGLDVENRLQDYRDVAGEFDRIVSIGMFEHVGSKNYRHYFAKARELLRDEGLMLLHTIGGHEKGTGTDPWMDRFIFPGGQIPRMTDIAHALEGKFVVEDWHNFGADYDRTLMAWFTSFNAAWQRLSSNYPPEFYRRWKLYLQSCAGAFRARQLQLWQVVLSPRGVEGGYNSVR